MKESVRIFNSPLSLTFLKCMLKGLGEHLWWARLQMGLACGKCTRHNSIAAHPGMHEKQRHVVLKAMFGSGVLLGRSDKAGVST